MLQIYTDVRSESVRTTLVLEYSRVVVTTLVGILSNTQLCSLNTLNNDMTISANYSRFYRLSSRMRFSPWKPENELSYYKDSK